MKKIRLYTLLALLMMVSRLFAFDFEAICSTGQTLYYNINEDGISVTITYPCHDGQYNYYLGYEKPEGDLVVPGSVEYQGIIYAVTKIGANAFYSCYSLGAATLPSTLVEIGQNAFDSTNSNGYGHHLIIPDSVVSVGEEAFFNVSVHELTIGASVRNIGRLAFDCNNLRIVHYNATDCEDLESPPFGSSYVNTLTIGENVLYIPSRLFYFTDHFTCDVVIPNSVVRIGDKAFFESGVTSLVVGDGVVEIGEDAFFLNHNLTSLKLGTGLKTIRENAFFDCGIEGHLVLPDSLEVIEATAFHCCNIDTLTIGTSMISIGWGAFSHNNFGTIYVKTVVPPFIGFQYFTDNQYYDIEVHVPCESLCDYLYDENWSIFHNITASFPYHLNVESADLQMGTASIIGVPNCCDSAVVRAYPRQGFEFDRWEADGVTVSQTETYTFQLEQDLTLVAYFKVYDGIEENNSATVEIYPNPAKEKITINGIYPADVQVYNAHGQLMKMVQGTNEISVTGLPEGVYLLRIMDVSGRSYSAKVLVKE